MGSLLALSEGMRTLGLLIALLIATPQAQTDQRPIVPEGTIITSAQVTGFDINHLSPGLRQEIRNLAGTPLKQEDLGALAARIEAERPDWVAAVRAVMDPGGQANVFFVMGRRDVPDRGDNINDRYIVEQADIHGVPETELTAALQDELRALAGQRLDSGAADRLQERIERELPGYEVTRRIPPRDRGGPHPPRLRSAPEGAAALAALRAAPHERALSLGPGVGRVPGPRHRGRQHPVHARHRHRQRRRPGRGVSGFGLRFETRKLGTRRLGASLEWSTFDQDWREATLAALAVRPGIPGLYENRSSVTPLLKFALTPHLSAAGGVSISELEALAPGTGSQMANAAVFSIDFARDWTDAGDATHHVKGGFGVRAGVPELESDLAYTRYFGQGSYRFDAGRHHAGVTGLAGGITGQPPLFERFTLGDSTTLRGWDKYESRRRAPIA